MTQRIEKTKTPVGSDLTAKRAEQGPAGHDFQSPASSLVQRAAQTPARLMPTDVMMLQRTIGNEAVARLLYGSGRGAVKDTPVAQPTPTVQTKLTVGSSNDKYEQEADQVAEQAVRKTDGPSDQPAARVTQPNAAVVQRKEISKAPKSQATPLIQRKLTWQHTAWANARYMDASTDGSGGVLFVGEERAKEVVVKPGDATNLESVMAAMLINDTTQGKSDFVQAPGVRIATKAEANVMQEALTPLINQAGSKEKDEKEAQFQKERVAKLVAKLSEPGAAVQDLAVGRGFSEAAPSVNKHTEKKTLGGRKFRKESPLRIFKDRRSIEAMGKATTVDVFTGNKDRLLGVGGGIGRGNFMVSPTTIRFIDNIWQGSETSFFKDTTVKYSDTKNYIFTAQEGTRKWKGDATAKALAAGDYTSITDRIWKAIEFNGAKDTRDKDKQAFAKTMAPYKDRFFKYFALGLTRGKASLIASLNGIMQNPEKFTSLVPGSNDNEVQQVLATMKARKEFLEGNIG